jgi:hypothetical protein
MLKSIRYLKIAFKLALLQKRKNKIGAVNDMPTGDSSDAYINNMIFKRRSFV